METLIDYSGDHIIISQLFTALCANVLYHSELLGVKFIKAEGGQYVRDQPVGI
jgi:hypothetical protein